jgi:hypothetical protein
MLTALPTSIPPAPPAYMARVSCPDDWQQYTAPVAIIKSAPSTTYLRLTSNANRPFPQAGDVRIESMPDQAGDLRLIVTWMSGPEGIMLTDERILDPTRGYTTAQLDELCPDRTFGQLVVDNGATIVGPTSTVDPPTRPTTAPSGNAPASTALLGG